MDDLAASVTLWQRSYIIASDFSDLRRSVPTETITHELKLFNAIKPNIDMLAKTIRDMVKATSQMKY